MTQGIVARNNERGGEVSVVKFTYPSLFDPHRTIEVWFCDEPCCSGKHVHRDDGPAVIYPDGTKEWWQHGKKLTDAEAAALNGELVAKAVRAGLSAPAVVNRTRFSRTAAREPSDHEPIPKRQPGK